MDELENKHKINRCKNLCNIVNIVHPERLYHNLEDFYNKSYLYSCNSQLNNIIQMELVFYRLYVELVYVELVYLELVYVEFLQVDNLLVDNLLEDNLYGGILLEENLLENGL